MSSRRKLAMTNFVFFASFMVQNRVNRRIDRSSADALICQSPVGAGLRVALPVPCKGIELCLPWADMEVRPYDGIIDANPGLLNAHSLFTTHHPQKTENTCVIRRNRQNGL